MLNEQKIKKMRKLATYESGKGRKQLRISKYYRSDYIGLSLIKNFFLTTIDYGLLLLVYFGSKSDYLMDNINQIGRGCTRGESNFVLSGYDCRIQYYYLCVLFCKVQTGTGGGRGVLSGIKPA